jgi:hypothetical protein
VVANYLAPPAFPPLAHAPENQMRKIATVAVVLTLLGSLMACSQGPAERTGSSLDKAGQNLRDAVDPPAGPGEKLGRSIDRATQ